MKLAEKLMTTVDEKFGSSDIKELDRMIGSISTRQELHSFLNSMGAKFREAFEANHSDKETKEFEAAFNKFYSVIMKYYDI